jgi:UDP-glucose:(heptosyl)LPS alpha-1,3-glucosyltransferase
MKVALVIDRMDPARGGRELSVAEIAVELAWRGARVAVYCRSADWQAPGVEVVELGDRGRTRWGRLMRFVDDVHRCAAARGEDIVHSTIPLPGADVYQLRSGTMPAQRLASLRRRGWLARSITAATRPWNVHRALLARMERQVLADRRTTLLAVSRMVADEIARFYGRTENVEVVYNAVRTYQGEASQWQAWRDSGRKELGIRPEEPVFLTLATNFKLKGIRESLRAFALWRRTRPDGDGRMVILGRDRVGPYRRLAQWLGIGKAVHFVPHERDVFRWYAMADACLLLSWYDPCSRVVLEAVRLGVPSITSAFNGAAEVLRDGAGLVVDSPSNTPAVVEAMQAMADPARREAMHQACRHVGDRLSTEAHVAGLWSVYERILQEKQSTEERLAAMNVAAAHPQLPPQWMPPPERKAV